ncbi:inositol hexakisphosphate kinase 1, partial [Eurytemora carolleeae]|uniref:inositol hexakisphosphate kinase 1 n=1 Tax=Eurytemora carolleeae TaxID=1294199 RepID=UPI000C756134
MGDRLVRDRLPELSFQVGGHRTMKVYRDNYVCKPLDRREEKFYSTFPKILEPFIPKFAGVLTVGSSESQDEFIMLENLCTGYRKPCVLDLKMGT